MRALVIVPTYNERHNLPVLAEQLLALPGVHMMVVDDGSPDGTGETADATPATCRLGTWCTGMPATSWRCPSIFSRSGSLVVPSAYSKEWATVV